MSEKDFDPLNEIYDADSEIPDPSAPILNNVETFAVENSGKKTGKSKKTEEIPANLIQRQFTEEQLPIQAPKKERRNILTFMNKQRSGPLSSLKSCVDESKRVKVVTRKRDGIRGFSTGILAAFDKHWNLALIDVDEEFSRPRRPKPEYDNGEKVRNSVEKVGESVIRVIKTRRNTQLCQRHVPQLLIRGEHVVLVQPL